MGGAEAVQIAVPMRRRPVTQKGEVSLIRNESHKAKGTDEGRGGHLSGQLTSAI